MEGKLLAVEQARKHIREASAIAALGGPLVVNNLVQMGMQVTDTVMAGRLGASELAAVALGGAVWMPMIVLGLGVMMALTPTVAQLFGAGRHAEIGYWTRQGMWLALFIVVPVFLLVRNAGAIMTAFGVEAAIVPLAGDYLKAQSWGLPAAFIYLALRFMSEGTSDTRPMMYISLAALPLNLFGNWLFMYEFGMGAVGCGVATAIVFWSMLAMMLLNVASRRRYRKFEPFARFDWPSGRALGELLWIGIPIGITIFMEGSMFGASALLMGRLGIETVAAHQIAMNFASIMFMIPMGLSFAISVRVGQAIGRGDIGGAHTAGWAGIALCASIMLLSAANMLLFREAIAALYSQDPRVIAVASGLLVMAALFQISDGLQVSAAGVLRGFKDTRATMVLSTIAYWGVGFLAAWYFGIHLGLGARAIWGGLIAGLTVAAALLLWRFAYNMRHARVV